MLSRLCVVVADMDVPEPGEAPRPVCEPLGRAREANVCLSDQEVAGTLLQVWTFLTSPKYIYSYIALFNRDHCLECLTVPSVVLVPYSISLTCLVAREHAQYIIRWPWSWSIALSVFGWCRLLKLCRDDSLNVAVPMRMLEVFSSERTYVSVLQDANCVTALIEQILHYMVQKGKIIKQLFLSSNNHKCF